MEALGYFVECFACEPEKEVNREPATDKANVFEEFFVVGHRMPSHPVLTNILVKFHVQPH
jgi:hypothetical protein